MKPSAIFVCARADGVRISGSGVFRAHAYKTKVLKTFGAGDSYASAFIYGLVSGRDIETALKYGSASFHRRQQTQLLRSNAGCR